MWPTIVTVIAAHNEENTIEKCLRSLLAYDLITGCVVVLDRCTDSTSAIVEAIAARDKRCTVLKKEWEGNRIHLGHRVAATYNVGLKYLTSGAYDHNDAAYVIRLDSDSRLPPDYLGRALAAFLADDRIGAVCLRNETGSRNGTGTIISRAALESIANREPSCARDDTSTHNMIEARGFRIVDFRYDSAEYLMVTPHKESRWRKFWGYRGIGYAEFEMCLGPLGMLCMTARCIRRRNLTEAVLYPTGYVEAYMRRAARIEELRAYSNTRQAELLAQAKRKMRRLLKGNIKGQLTASRHAQNAPAHS